MSGSVGVSIGTDGLMFNAGVSGSRGRGEGNDVTQVNTHVDAGNKLSITSGTDTTLAGAVASGKQVEVNVGTGGQGNLNIASLQDTSTYKSNQQSMGVSISAGMGKVSGSLNASRSSVDGNYASVNEQSGINAGDGGFQVNVNGKTDLKGSKIASTDKAAAEGKNSFTTQTLTTSDIQNHSDYKAESQSVGVGTGYSGSQLSMNGTGVGIGSSSGSESSTTKSGITDIAGDKTVRSDKDSSGKLTKNWDGQQLQSDVQAQAQITQMFGKESAKAIGTYATQQLNQIDDKIKVAKTDAEKAELIAERAKWEEGGVYRTALHTAAGALGGGIGGALGAATSSVAMPQIAKLIDGMDLPQAVKQGLAQVTATVLGGVVGGTSGLAAGVNVEANNRQLHLSETQKLAGLKQGKTKAEQDRLDAAACALVGCAEGIPQSDPYYSQLLALQNRGASYEKEMTDLLKTGEFVYQPYLDAARDKITKNGELAQRAVGAANLLLGTTGVVASGALAATGVAGCAPSAGATCALVPLSVYLGTVSGMQAQEGSRALTGSYNSKEGQRVLDSFNVATYPGERDPLAELGIDAGKLGLTYVLGKYVPKVMSKAEELALEKSLAGSGKSGNAQVVTADKPSVRTGAYDGKKVGPDDATFSNSERRLPLAQGTLTGEPEAPRKNASKEDIRSIDRQNEAAKTLSEHGLNVEMLPNNQGRSGLKQPDLLVNGESADVYSPRTKNVQQIWETVSKKADPDNKQASSIVVNLADSPLNASEVGQYFQRNPVSGLEKILLIKDGKVIVVGE